MPEVQPKRTQNSSTWAALGLAWELGYTIAVPLVVLALVGRLLDRTFHTSPWFLLVGVLLSIVASSLLVLRKTKGIMAEADRSQPPTDTTPHPTV